MKQLNVSSTCKLDLCPARNLPWRPLYSCHIPLKMPRYTKIENGHFPHPADLFLLPAQDILIFLLWCLNAYRKTSYPEEKNNQKSPKLFPSKRPFTCLTILSLNKHHPLHNYVIYAFHLRNCADPGSKCRLRSLSKRIHLYGSSNSSSHWLNTFFFSFIISHIWMSVLFVPCIKHFYFTLSILKK